MPGVRSESNQVTNTTDDHSVHLSAYLAYLSIIFTMIILLMAGWVIITIKITRRLQKIHNIFIAHLMVTDVISASTTLLLYGTMIIECSVGVEDPIDCSVFRFLLFPMVAIYFSFLMIAISWQSDSHHLPTEVSCDNEAPSCIWHNHYQMGIGCCALKPSARLVS